MTDIVETKYSSLSEDVYITNKNNVKNYMVSILSKLSDKKTSYTTMSYKKIAQQELKAKDNEKKSKLDKLTKMPKQQRDVEKLKMKHKLGIWGIGLQKSLIEYDARQVDNTHVVDTSEENTYLNAEMHETNDISHVAEDYNEGGIDD